MLKKPFYICPHKLERTFQQENRLQLFDSHCHLDDRSYKTDLESVLQRAGDAGVSAMMIAGVDLQSVQRALALADRYPGLYAAVGIHPHDAESCNETVLEQLRQLAQNPKVRAWGEIGLDFNRMYSPRKDQENWFIRQLAEAAALNLPVIIHERDSGGRLIEILEQHPDHNRQGVVHCFSGNGDELDRYLDMGFCIGVTGIVTIQKRGAALRQLIPKIPDNRLLVETDAPYLTPAPEKNKTRRNEPAFVKRVLMKLAEIRNQEPGELARITTENACRLFGITAPANE
jgi:TatD DNase family protein